MPRELKPCGTRAAYARHKRNGETPCAECVDANRSRRRGQKRDEAEATAEVVKLAIVEAPEPERIDELSEARENLRIVKATMLAGVPSGMAALSKQYAELVALIKRLESAADPKESKLDELARRRAERLAASQD